MVSSAGCGQLVVVDGGGAVVEEVEHLAGVELGAAAEPVAAVGLGGGFEVVLGGVLDVVLAALGVGEAEPGHLKAGVDEVAGFVGVGEDGFVDGDGAGAVSGVLGEVGLFEAEEIVVGVLGGEAVLDDEGLLRSGRRGAGRGRGRCGIRRR